MPQESREVGAQLLDVVGAVTRMGQELLELRARVVKLESVNQQLFADWESVTKQLHEAQARLLEYDEAEAKLKRDFPELVSNETSP